MEGVWKKKIIYDGSAMDKQSQKRWQLGSLFFFFKAFFKIFIYLFIYLWLCWVFVSVRGLSLVVASGGHSSSRCAGLSPSRPLLLRSTGSRRAGSAVVTHGPSCSAACGIFPDQGSNPCHLHWQADSQPLHHQGSPWDHFLKMNGILVTGKEEKDPRLREQHEQRHSHVAMWVCLGSFWKQSRARRDVAGRWHWESKQLEQTDLKATPKSLVFIP